MKMHFKLLLNDFRKRAWKNIILFTFMCLSVVIAATVVLMLSQLFASISEMYETAKPPHFLQMHMGPVDETDINSFNESYEGVTHWQTIPTINLYGDHITVVSGERSYTLADCRLDIGFVRQNKEYDVLLDANRAPLQMAAGEIGVPIIVLDQYPIALGDRIIINSGTVEKAFTVKEYVYDGMMNSTTCSSTRFLISDEDFQALLGKAGETEYLIETYFTDSSLASAYQTAYEQDSRELPKNGQAITYTVIFLLSALTDILTAMVFVLAGAVLIMIVVICLRYIILAELEDDVTEIGTMKSMGVPDKGIGALYLSKIRILMSVACVAGFLLSIVFLPGFTGHISRFFGEQPMEMRSLLMAVAAVLLIYGIIMIFARKILKQIRSKTVVDLMILNDGFGKKIRVKSGLHKSSKLPVNVLVGLNEVRSGYGVVFILMLIITFLIMVPMRALETVEAEDFVTYMGNPVCDLQIEVLPGNSLEERNEALEDVLESEELEAVRSCATLRRVRLQAMNKAGEPVGVHIDTGLTAGQDIVYLGGAHPSEEKHIALSYLMAEELGMQTGDEVTVITDNGTAIYEICGVYQDVTSGGKTAKAMHSFPGEPAEKYTYQLQLLPERNADDFAEELRTKLGAGYSVKSMEDFLDQTLGGVTSRFSQAVYLIILIGMVITIFIVLLFMELRLARTMHALAEKIAMGISLRDVCRQELYPMLIPGCAGVIAGMILAECMGEVVVSALFSMLGLGITSISFTAVNISCLVIPLSLIIILAVINTGVCRKLKKIEISAYFNQ